MAEASPSGVEIATEYWDLRLAFWRPFAGALALRSIAVLFFTVGKPASSLRQALAVALFGTVVFAVWAGVFPRAAAVVLMIVAAVTGFGGPLLALSQHNAWTLLAVPFDLLAFFLARRAVPVAKPYKLARRRARRARRDVRIRAGGGM